jgi:hypothetical protein
MTTIAVLTIQGLRVSSIYRLNAKTADCYAFSLYRNNRGKIDFQGGYDWKNSLVDKTATDLYLFKTKTFVKIS